MAINPDDMIPVELLVLKPTFRGIGFTPTAFLAQHLELHDPAAWAFHKAHALAQGTHLASYLLLRD